MKQNNGLRIVSLLVLAGMLLGLLSACSAAPAAAAEKTLPAEVSVAEAVKLRDAGAFVLDVRTPEEWRQVHIPGATLIPLDELPDRVKEVPADKNVLVVCRSGNRSAAGRDILKKAGLENVTSMAGGMNQWASQGLPTTAGD